MGFFIIPDMLLQKQLLIRITFLVVFVAMNLNVFAQTYNFKNYSVEDGLPFIQISTIYQDQDGYLWSGGYGGLSRFNGFEFTNYSTRDGLANHFVTSIAEDAGHQLWVGTIEGLSYFDHKKLKSIRREDGLPDNKINCLLTRQNGEMIIGTAKGLSLYKDAHFHTPAFFLNKTITCLATDQKNNLLIGTNQGVFQWKNNGKIDSVLFDTPGSREINCIKADSENKMWIGTKSGLFCFNYDLKQYQHFRINNGLIDESITCIETDTRNNIWIGSQKGLLKFDGKKFSYYKIGDDVNANHIECLKTDFEENLWIGSHQGLYKYRDEGFVSFDKNDGLENTWVYGINGDKENIWVSTRGGLFNYSENKFHKYSLKNGLNSDTVNSLIYDKHKVMWVGDASGLSIYKDKRFISFSSLKGIPCHYLFFDKEGKLWIGSTGKVLCLTINYVNYTIAIKTLIIPIPDKNYQVWGITQDKVGNMWFGNYLGGLYKYDGKTFTCINKRLNLKANDFFSLQYNPQTNTIYAASFDGVYAIEASTYKVFCFNEAEGLSSNLVYDILLTDNGNTLWAGTNQGINKIDLWQFNKSGTNYIVAYGKADGFRGVESNTNGSFKDEAGNLWFGTVNGLIKYDPHQLSENLHESKLRINQIHLFYKDTILSDGAVLNYNLNNISIHYNAICLSNPEKIRYIHKLEGIDNFWSPETKENFARYSNLPPGKYTFKVRSCNNSGIWNLEPVTFSFSITPPYWQRWWFVFSVLLFVLCAIILIFRLRLNQIKKEQEKEAKNQIAIIQNELKALRAQMNPHFLFNSLNSIQHYIIANKDEEAMLYLNKFARLMRMILTNSEKASITLREEIDSLNLYLELEAMRFNNKFEYTFEIDPELDIDYESIPSMLLQPYVENAVLHGLTPKKERGNLIIRIAYREKYIVCSIIDDGVGRNYAREQKINQTREHRSMGMKITSDRLRLLNRMNQSALSVKITDLKNDQGLAIGTKVDIFIPIT